MRDNAGLPPRIKFIGNPVTAPPVTASATSPAPAAILNAPSNGAPTYLAASRWNLIRAWSASERLPSRISSSCRFKYDSYFSDSLRRASGAIAEWKTQFPAPPAPRSTTSSDEKAVPARAPAMNARVTEAALPGFFFAQRRALASELMSEEGSLAEHALARAASVACS